MKIHTTNYTHTFIAVAEDCPVDRSTVPPMKGDTKTIANWQYEILSQNPYRYDSDEVFFQIYTIRNDIPEQEIDEARQKFFSKGQPCFRSSPLTKRYGWGIHSNGESKIALFGMETAEYEQFMNDQSLAVVKAMRSKRNKK